MLLVEQSKSVGSKRGGFAMMVFWRINFHLFSCKNECFLQTRTQNFHCKRVMVTPLAQLFTGKTRLTKQVECIFCAFRKMTFRLLSRQVLQRCLGQIKAQKVNQFLWCCKTKVGSNHLVLITSDTTNQPFDNARCTLVFSPSCFTKRTCLIVNLMQSSVALGLF